VVVVQAAAVDSALVAVAPRVDAGNHIVLEYFNKYCNNVTTQKNETS